MPGRPGPRPTALTLLLGVLLTALLSPLLTACGYGSQAPHARTAPLAAGGPALSAGTVTLGYLPTLTHSTALIGVREGFLQRELGGTRLKTATFRAGPAAVEALAGGSVDIAFLGPSPAVNSYSRSHGRSLRIIGGAASGGVRLVADPARVAGPDDLEGRRVATPQRGNTQDVALLRWTAAHGLHVDPVSGRGQVSVLRIDSKTLPHAYRSGAVDAAWVPEPTASELVAQGARVLLDERDLWPGRRFAVANIVVSQGFLRRHPDVVEAVLRGTVTTNAWIRARPDRARTAAGAALGDLLGRPLPASVLAPAWRSVEFLDDPLAATLRTQSEHAAATGLLQRPYLAGIYDLTPLNHVLASLGRPRVSGAGLDAHDQGR